MAIVAADLEKRYSRRTTIDLERMTIMLQLCSQAFTEGWVAGANTVYIPKPDWAADDTANPAEGIKVTSRSRGGNWASFRRVDQDLLAFTRSGGFASSMLIPWEDALELPWPVVERTRVKMRQRLRREIEDGIFSAITAALAAETDTPNFQAYGDDTNFISRGTGKVSTTAARGYVYEAIVDFSLKIEESDANSDVSDAVGQKWCLMPPALFRILRDDIRLGRYSWDEITRSILAGGSILGGKAWKGRLEEIDIYSWNGVPKPSGVGANTAADRDHNWQMLFGVKAANAAAIRPSLVQYMTPRENQVTPQPGHAVRMVGDYGYLLLEPNLMTLAAIDGGADKVEDADMAEAA